MFSSIHRAWCKSTLQFDQRCFVPVIRGSDRCEVLISDYSLEANRCFGPLGDRVTVTLEPDVGKHPRPAPVAIQERVNRNPPVMESYGRSLFAPKTALGSREKFVRGLIDHLLDRLIVHRLALEARGSLHKTDEPSRLSFGLLPLDARRDLTA
jgi:hypothetical protein